MSPDRDGEASMRECSNCGATCDVDVAVPAGAPIECTDRETDRVSDEVDW